MVRVKFRVMVKLRIKVVISVSGELSPRGWGGGSKGLTDVNYVNPFSHFSIARCVNVSLFCAHQLSKML